MDRLFDKAFSRAAAGLERAVEGEDPQRKRPRVDEVDEEARLRQASNPMNVADAIQRILLAEKDKDYFR
jgi:hypothetical protein